MKRYLKYIIILISLLLLWGLCIFFEYELIDLKERYLIKQNFSNNEDLFHRTVDDFKLFPNLSIEFAEENYMDAYTSGLQYADDDTIDAVTVISGTTAGIAARVWAIVVDVNEATKDAAEVDRDQLA